jgi:hypothetical protein
VQVQRRSGEAGEGKNTERAFGSGGGIHTKGIITEFERIKPSKSLIAKECLQLEFQDYVTKLN